MKTIKLFAIDAGDKSTRIIGYATTEYVAKVIAKGNGFWGSDAGVFEQNFKVYESVEDYKTEQEKNEIKRKDNIKSSAPNKLTREEKESLGIFEN